MALTADSVEAAADFDAAISATCHLVSSVILVLSGRVQALNKPLSNGWRMSRASPPLRNSMPR